MKIARYIGDLLYDYECVVVPGLGGFLTSETPATIDPVSNHFKPPFKKIFFNAQLRANDGLLVNYVAKEMGLTYKDAKAQVDKFVFLCHNALKNGKRINFHKIGYIYYNEKEQIVFEQDTTINYDAESYGLTSFVSPAIRRISKEEHLKEKITSKVTPEKPTRTTTKPVDRKPEPQAGRNKRKQPETTRHMQAEVRRSPYKTQLAFVSLLVLGILTGIAIMHRDAVKFYYNRHASEVPFFYRSPVWYMVDNLDNPGVAAIAGKNSVRQFALWVDNMAKKLESKKETGEPSSATAENNSKPAVAGNDLADTEETTRAVPVENKGEPEQNTQSGTVQQASLLDNLLPEENSEITTEPEENQSVSTTPENPVPADHTAAAIPETKTAAEVTPESQGGFYIIAGSFKNVRNARKLIRRLKAKGFEALIADTNRYGMYRVAYGQFETMDETRQKLFAIRKNENPGAWLMHK